jgi:ribulose-5-phosphate 4-epimerase/fuculose-1-phosphate aldolase
MAIIERPMPEAAATRKPGISEEEWELRVQLAACYRVFDFMGWTELIFNHISLRVPGPETHLLINPFGLRYKEVTASNLVKIDLQGNIVGDSEWPVNRAGVIIHTAIHGARHDVHAVMHTHTTAGSAVAGLESGVDSNNFYASQLWGQIRYHDFEGITLDPDEQERLIGDLGDQHVLVLRNHGLLSTGATLPAAFLRLWTIERACEIQVATMSTGVAPRVVSDHAHSRSSEDYLATLATPTAGLRAFEALQRQVDEIDDSYRY